MPYMLVHCWNIEP